MTSSGNGFTRPAMPARLGDLPTLGPGLTTVILRTPLGVWIVDPFAPADPAVDRIIKALGIEVEVKLGPPSTEDLAATQLSTGLMMAATLLGVVGYQLYKGFSSRHSR